ncbi:benzoate/H(+) symporter BenE family transporter [Minwuia thermotolerans]|uniref:Benzoate transporter n=1 Tax=Minwuia thermotolerans TaxID=2056226 RepID=A0A2M9G2T4_9PROT|nr:benzoate/H(+) symporter BenE family transporter [Minwuia thermotolerans]PJK30010.1 benzoate transporter [Minwuia thermotolerans]
MFRDISAQAVGAGLLAAVVGFASSFAVILAGLTAVGASPAEAASGLMALSLAMGLPAILFSAWLKQPISIAWSTPGGALLASSAALDGGFAEAVGAFVISGLLIIAAGLFRPFGRAVQRIPGPLANAMLAGVLFGLCLAPVRAIAEQPLAGILIVLAWIAVARINRLFAVPAAVLVTAVLIVTQTEVSADDLGPVMATPMPIAPQFTLEALGLALPLFLVTMASQNIPGIAVLNANGYRPAPGPLFTGTGLFTLAAAPFGAHAVNLAAITAALCAGPDAHPDPARRYWAGIMSGVFYVLLAFTAGWATAFIGAAPPVLIEAVAGLALLGAFAGAVVGAVEKPEGREAAVITFIVTASGLAFFGISGAFWGLLAGGAVWALDRWRKA